MCWSSLTYDNPWRAGRGKEVIASLKKIDPEVKTIVSSGYSSDHAMTDFAEYGFVAACAKPYLLSEMKAIVERFV